MEILYLTRELGPEVFTFGLGLVHGNLRSIQFQQELVDIFGTDRPAGTFTHLLDRLPHRGQLLLKFFLPVQFSLQASNFGQGLAQFIAQLVGNLRISRHLRGLGLNKGSPRTIKFLFKRK